MKVKQYILLLGFIGFISFPIINTFFGFVNDSKSNENRALKTFPKLSLQTINTTANNIETYLIDRLSMRNYMIKLYNQLNVFVFKSSPVLIKAFIGTNGWYYFSGEELKTFAGTELFTVTELETIKNDFTNRQKIINNYGAQLYIAIVPVKANIYSEFLPNYIIKANTVGYGKQLQNYLQQNGLPIIDLYKPLLTNKNQYPVFYKTDNHWNNFGGFVAANAILQAFKPTHKNISLLNTDNFTIKKVTEKAGAIAKMLSIEDNLSDENYIPTPKIPFKSVRQNLNKYSAPKEFPYPWDYEITHITKDTTLPKLLIIRDSFGEKLLPYLSEQCQQCTAIFDNWEYKLNETIIKNEKPDIVLYVITEGKVKNLLKN